jgi:hypothetical protein
MTTVNSTELGSVPLEGGGPSGSPPPDVDDSMGLHRSSHLQRISLLPRYGTGVLVRRLPLSGVVVPTSRPLSAAWGGLALAARCAEEKDAQLVIIRSGSAIEEPFPSALGRWLSRRPVVIDVPDDAPRAWVPPRTSRHLVGNLERDSDLGFKRNLGLLLGLMAGWEAVLFLDDDLSVAPVGRWPLRQTIGVGGPLPRLDDVLADLAVHPDVRAAGYLQKDFDDNSVVCHARKLLGEPQGGFISGGAMVVRIGTDLPFFPAVYNEDWLFLFALLVEGRQMPPSGAVRIVDTVRQRPYYPFSALRARSEELGDLLAEGLFALLDRPRSEVLEVAGSADYWERAVWERQSMVLHLLVEFRRRHPHVLGGVPADVDVALRASLAVSEGSCGRWGDLFAGYVRDYLLDLADWRALLEAVAPPGRDVALDIVTAVDELGLRCGTTLAGASGERAGSPPERVA